MDSEKIKVIAQEYLYAAVAAVGAFVAAGVTDPKVLGMAALSGVLGPIVKAANPKDKSIGIGVAKAVLEATEAEIKKQAPAAAKKVAKKSAK